MPLPPSPTVQPRDIATGLAALGVRPGDALLLHSALSSLGQVAGGAEALVNALLELLGPAGTLVVPTLPDVTQPFSAESSPSTTGKVTEIVRLWPGARRSHHPTHAVAAIGAQASFLTKGHEHTLPCGPDSPYGRLGQLRGWVLLLGVDQDRNTTWHTAETIADVPYLRTLTVRVRQADGSVRAVSLPKSPRGHREFIRWDRPLREAGLLRLGWIGTAAARLMRADELVAFGVERLRADPTVFLCAKPRCVFCQWARSIVGQARGQPAPPMDWAAAAARWGCGAPNCEVCIV
jgi:aminoglycoside 3-N-acetyltransferase